MSRDAAKGGLHYVGFVGLDGRAVITDSSASGELWGYRVTGGSPVLLGHMRGSDVSLVAPVLELAPLYALASTRDELLAEAKVNPQDPLYAGFLPPLFDARPAPKSRP